MKPSEDVSEVLYGQRLVPDHSAVGMCFSVEVRSVVLFGKEKEKKQGPYMT